MDEKFSNLSKKTKVVLSIIAWFITAICFVGSSLAKKHLDVYWLEIVLTSIGLFFSIFSVCITILSLLNKPKDEEED